ncbi:hypothetical protein FSP39_024498 [Pinctada imbricata]|uniref:CCHC-type domain-containing protein n=1 Tax=Pinctada imbricata TaxID=66713 RepID=A0AA88YG39_PINIB|nr:hypothetical protein FSP39_024498 [Pinctada imbricata]
MPLKKDLEKQIFQLQQELADVHSTRPKVYENHTYIAKDRKIKTFSGRPKSSNDMTVDDWIDDIRLVFWARKATNAEKVDIIYSHLEGEAKDEIKFRTDIRHDPEAILECLQTAFGDPDSVTVLQQRFFERHQRDTETIRQYSYVLLDLFQKVRKKDDSVFPNKERTLCEQFANSLSDPFIRKEMKRLVRSNPGMEFFDLRNEAILLSEEEENSVSVRKVDLNDKAGETSSMCNESQNLKPKSDDHSGISSNVEQLLKVVEAQQKQIDSLTTLMKDQSLNKQYTPRWNYDQVPRWNYDQAPRWNNDQRKCYKCNRTGHVQRNCPNNTEGTNEDSGNK